MKGCGCRQCRMIESFLNSTAAGCAVGMLLLLAATGLAATGHFVGLL
jgi:hypothetical protein